MHTCLVVRSEIFREGLPLLRVYDNAVVAVVGHVPYQARLLGQGQETALHGGHLQIHINNFSITLKHDAFIQQNEP